MVTANTILQIKQKIKWEWNEKKNEINDSVGNYFEI